MHAELPVLASTALAEDGEQQQERLSLFRRAAIAKVTKRPNGTYAHLLRLPSTIPYAIRLHAASPQGTVHVLPCLSPAVAQFIREDAERTAQRLGGWAPRAVGCCTNDVLVSQLSAASQQHVLDAFRRVIVAMRAFLRRSLADSPPRSVECFFVIKYKADKNRREFGEHIDHRSSPSTSRYLAGDRLRGGRALLPAPRPQSREERGAGLGAKKGV